MPNLSGEKERSPTGVKFGNYDGNTCLQTFMARFENYADYFDWDETDKLFQLRASLAGAAGQILWNAGKQSTVGQIIALLKARFGSENQAERFRAALRSRKRSKGESLQKLYQDVRRLIYLAYPGESSTLSDIVGRDAFLEALDDQTLRVRILEKEPKNVDEALNIASRLEAFDVMGSVGPEGEKNKVKYARAAAGGKECTGSEGAKVPEEITKQIADLKTLVSSYRRELDKQQQEISALRRGLQPPYLENWNFSPDPHPAVQHGPVRADLFRSPNRSHAKPPRWAARPHEEEEVTESAADLNQTTTVGTVEQGATGHASAESLGSEGLHRRPAEIPEGRSASSPPDGTGSTCTWPTNYTGEESTDCSILGVTRQLSVNASFQTNRSNPLLRNCSRRTDQRSLCWGNRAHDGAGGT